jgi:hypothetical protein
VLRGDDNGNSSNDVELTVDRVVLLPSLPVADNVFDFLNVAELGAVGSGLQTGTNVYAKDNTVTGASIAIRKNIPARSLQRVIFIRESGTVPVMIGNITIDAAYGIVDINSNNNVIDNVVAYQVRSITQGGATLFKIPGPPKPHNFH